MQVLTFLAFKLGDFAMWRKFVTSKIGLSIVSCCLGFIATLGFAPYNLWLVTLITLAFEFCLIANLNSPKKVFFALWIYFTTLNAITLNWLNFVMHGYGNLALPLSIFIEILFAAYLAFFHALFGFLAYKFAHRGLKSIKTKEHDKSQEHQESSPKNNLDDTSEDKADDFNDDYDDYEDDPSLVRGLASNTQDLSQTPAHLCEKTQDTPQSLTKPNTFKKAAFLLCFLPIALILADLLIGVLFSGFPWMYIGYTALEGPFSAYAPLIGVRGISLVMFICAGAIALTVERKYIYLPIAGMLFLLGIFLLGINYTQDLPKFKVAAVQGNIAQQIKWNPEQILPSIRKYTDLTMELFGSNDLIVWPESAIPVFIQQIPSLAFDLNVHAYATDTPLMMGIQRVTPERKSYNSIYLLGQSEDYSAVQYYDKRQLVPFGETVPFEQYTRKLGPLFNFPMSSFTAGTNEQKQFHLLKRNLYLIPALCYESIFPELMMSLHDEHTNGIVMVSNDSWYGNTRGPQEHLAIARMRSLEMQKPMIRVTNSGITAHIDKNGKLIDVLPTNKEGVLSMEVTLTKGMTPVVRFFNIQFYILVIALLVLGIYLRQKEENVTQEELARLIRP